MENFEPTDRIAMLVLHRDFSETIQRITSAETRANPQFQAWLRYKNANGSDMYVTWNRTGVTSSLLIGTYFDQAILMLDADEAGSAATTAAATALSSIVAVQIVELASGTQPDQLASEEIKQLLGGFAHDVPTPDR